MKTLSQLWYNFKLMQTTLLMSGNPKIKQEMIELYKEYKDKGGKKIDTWLEGLI